MIMKLYLDKRLLLLSQNMRKCDNCDFGYSIIGYNIILLSYHYCITLPLL